MKALDTGVLLSILHGDRGMREFARRYRGVEMATTELNLLELENIVQQGPARGRGRRQEALRRLRRSLTVLPLDAKALEKVALLAEKGVHVGPALVELGVLGVLAANGCDEWITTSAIEVGGKWPFKVTRFKVQASQ